MAVKLEKGKPVSLAKSNGIMTVTLRWTSRTDVDLACMHELVGHKPSVVQALDKDFGSLERPPYVSLDRDDRAGGQETLRVNLAHAAEIKRLLVFAYIYEGGTWRNVGDASVTVEHPSETYEIKLNGGGWRSKSCALVGLRSDGNGGLTLSHEEVYFNAFHEEIDRHFGWPNINWVKGTKD